MPPKRRRRKKKKPKANASEQKSDVAPEFLEQSEHLKSQGNVCFSAGDYQGAVDNFSAAISANPKNHVLFSNRSAANAKLERWVQAITDAKQCIKLAPDWPKGYSRLGLALFRTGKFDDAREAYGKGLALDPQSDQLADGIAAVREAQKKAKQREELMQRQQDSKNHDHVTSGAGDTKDIVVGIDLGTTFSCVAVWREGHVDVLPNAEGKLTTPSWVGFGEKGERLVGDPAKAQAHRFPDRTLFNIKRIIGQDYGDCRDDIKRMPFNVIENKAHKPIVRVDTNGKGSIRTLAPEQISAMVLEEMKRIAEEALGQPVTKAVITVPAYFNDAQRRFTKDAGTIAGLQVLRIINEPTAAALAYGLHKSTNVNETSRNILVFDLGGGTFDVSLLKIEDGVFEVLATAGDTHLGGEDFDSSIADWVISQHVHTNPGIDMALFTDGVRRKIRTACEQAKRRLSSSFKTEIELETGGLSICMELTREKFNSLNEKVFQRCMKSVKRVLLDAKVETEDVHEIVLVGGSTRVPRVRTILSEYFGGKELCSSVNPDEAVAYGAAVQGAILGGVEDETCRALLLVDVIPLSLGVETVGRHFAKVVERNTSVPCKRSSEFTTVQDYQTEIDMRIFEGERANTDGNHLLGEFSIKGIQRAKKGEAKIDVTFEVNSNGLLKVSAKDKVTGAEANVEIQHDRGQHSSEDIERMVAEAARFKAEDEARYEEWRKENLSDYEEEEGGNAL